MNRRIKALLAGAVVAAAAVAVWMVIPPGHDLVVYTSADAAYSRPLIKAFERETGLSVGFVPDGEAAKTTGLYHRLLSEKDRPQADVFWNNEISRTLLLARRGVLQGFKPANLKDIGTEFRGKNGLWYGLACRVRVIVYNTKLVAEKDAPDSIFDLVHERWKGKVAMAYPLFGTAATHSAALRAHKEMGREKTGTFFRQLVANGLQVVDGNAIVARRVASGEALVGLTDTDDAWSMIDKKHPIRIVYPDQGKRQIGALVIPNTASMIRGARHPVAARKFLDFLLSDRAERLLAQPPARHLPTRPEVRAAPDARPLYMIKPMKVDWRKVADEVDRQPKELERIFRRRK